MIVEVDQYKLHYHPNKIEDFLLSKFKSNQFIIVYDSQL